MHALADLLALSRHARLVTLACATQQAVAEALVAEQFTGREGVNALFGFELDALSTSADLDIDVLPGLALRSDRAQRHPHAGAACPFPARRERL